MFRENNLIKRRSPNYYLKLMKLTVIPRLRTTAGIKGPPTVKYYANQRFRFNMTARDYIVENNFKSFRYAKDEDQNIYMVFNTLSSADVDNNSYSLNRHKGGFIDAAARVLSLSKGDTFLLCDIEGAKEVKRLSLIPQPLKSDRITLPNELVKKIPEKESENLKPQLKMQEKKVHSQLGSSPGGNVILQKRTVYDLVVDSYDVK